MEDGNLMQFIVDLPIEQGVFQCPGSLRHATADRAGDRCFYVVPTTWPLMSFVHLKCVTTNSIITQNIVTIADYSIVLSLL